MGAPVELDHPRMILHGLEKYLRRRSRKVEPFAHEIKQIKEILKDHDTQNHLLPLKFHRHIKPPVHPPKRHLVEKEVVAGKKVPFSKVLAQRERMAMQATHDDDDAMSLNTIFETEDYEFTRRLQRSATAFLLH